MDHGVTDEASVALLPWNLSELRQQRKAPLWTLFVMCHISIPGKYPATAFKGYLESTVENENLSWPEVQLQNGNLLLNLRNQGHRESRILAKLSTPKQCRKINKTD